MMQNVTRSIVSIFFLIILVCGIAFAGNDIADFPSCKHCGMNREMFSRSRMLVEYADGSRAAFCSLHCASLDMALNIDRAVKHLHVSDYRSSELINAYEAFWVIGSDIKGVMSKRSKVAVSAKTEAEHIQKEHGGALTDFEGAIRASYQDMYDDTRMIREKRQMKKMQHGH